MEILKDILAGIGAGVVMILIIAAWLAFAGTFDKGPYG